MSHFKVINKFCHFWEKSILFSCFLVFVLLFIAFSAIYFSDPDIISLDDHFFHFKYAYLLRTEGWDAIKNFDWIYFSKTVQEHRINPVSLFQISLIPFTYFKDMILGLKISGIFWASITISLIYYVLRKIKIKIPFFFIILLMSSNYFVFRALSGRAFVLTTGLVFLEIYLAAGKKYKNLFFVSLFHILWHPSVFFVPFMAVVFVEAARYLETYRFYFKNLAVSFLASVLGIAMIPGFMTSIFEYIQKIISVVFSVSNNVKAEGMELYAKNTLTSFWVNTDIFFLMAVVSIELCVYYYMRNRREREKSKKENGDNQRLSILMYSNLFLLLMSIFGSIKISGRFFDYYVPAAVILASLILTKLAIEEKIKIDSSVYKYALSSAVIFFVFSAGNNFLDVRNQIHKSDYRPLGEVAKWIEARSDEKEVIFLNDWSSFPVSFFYNHKNVYAMGMEPGELRNYSPKLYWRWYNIYNYAYYCNEEKDCEEEFKSVNDQYKNLDKDQKEKEAKENSRKIIGSIKNDFGSRFIISNSLRLNGVLSLNADLIQESFEAKSEFTGSTKKAFELK